MARADRRRRARRSGRSSQRSVGGALFRWVPVVVVLALLGGAVAAYHFDLGTRWFGAAPDLAPPPPPVPGLTLPAVPTPREVARPAPAGALSAAAVRRALAPALANPHLARLRAVVASTSGRPALDLGHGTSTPASTLKLLTATAALQVLGPDHTFSTRVVAAGHRSLTLVGGGDPFLAGKRPSDQVQRGDASLQALAAQTAARLAGRGTTAVSLAYDTSLFSGPAFSPDWPKAYLPDDVVTPITALWADQGLVAPGHHDRERDPAAAAAALFATYLRKDGIRVTGTLRDRPAPPSAREVARVTSRPLADIVERVLQYSDNEGAEVLARQTGIAVSGAGSFEGGTAAVRRTLAGLGIDLRGARILDGSGLSRHDRLDPKTLVSVLQLVASADHPTLRPVVTGLPVAAYDGSLADRFGLAAGRGWVRAKTGTLRGTSALAGLVTDARGRLLVFAFVSNHVPPLGTLDAEAALDDLASALAGCRC